uniref:phosphopyruvate hydratase n=1 Tax=Noccaea caerulescens TaxID=107243 RepID=A0A1J3K5B2_NOCCA
MELEEELESVNATITSVKAELMEGAKTTLLLLIGLSSGQEVKATFPGGCEADLAPVVSWVNDILGPKIHGTQPACDHGHIDELITEQFENSKKRKLPDPEKIPDNLKKLASLVLSLAVCKAGASVLGVSVFKRIASLCGDSKKFYSPIPSFKLINASNDLAFMIIPALAQTFEKALNMAAEVYEELKSLIKERNVGATLRESGELYIDLPVIESYLNLLNSAIDRAKYKGMVGIGIDVSASRTYNVANKIYAGTLFRPRNISGSDILHMYNQYIKERSVISIEDAFHQSDKSSYAMLEETEVQIVHPKKLILGAALLKSKKTPQVLLWKLEQSTTLSQCIRNCNNAKKDGWEVILRDEGRFFQEFVYDLCIGMQLGQIKTGAPSDPKHYYRVVEIESDELKEDGIYRGATFRKPVLFSQFRSKWNRSAKTDVWWDVENTKFPRGSDPSKFRQRLERGLRKKGFTGGVGFIRAVAANKILIRNGETLDQSHLPGIDYHFIEGKEGVKNACDDWIKNDINDWNEDRSSSTPQNAMLISGDGWFESDLGNVQDKNGFVMTCSRDQCFSTKINDFGNENWGLFDLLGKE